MHTLHTSLYAFPKSADQDDLFINRELLWLVTQMFDSVVMFQGEIGCQSLLGVKGLNIKETVSLPITY